MSESMLLNNNNIPKYGLSPQFNSDRIQYNDSSLSMDDEFSDSEYNDLKDDVPSPSKRGRGQIQNGIRRSPNKWTEEEDQKLFQLVNIYGEKKWKRISAEMGGQKTGAQCAQHWKRVLSPDIRKGPWDEEEEELLLRLVNQHGSSWKKIAKRICKRTDIQCRYQYLKSLQSREVAWVPKEDEVLVKKVEEMNENLSWLEVSEYLAKLKHTNTLRTALECKTRYYQLTGKGSNILPPLNSSNVSSLNSSSASSYNQQHNMQYNNNNNNQYNNNQYHNNQYNQHNNNNNMQYNNQYNNNNNQYHNNNNNHYNNSNNNIKPHSLSPLSSIIDSNSSSPSFDSCNDDMINNNNNNNNNNHIFRPTPHKPVIANLTSPSSSPIPSSPPSSSSSSPTNCNNNNSNNHNHLRQPSPSTKTFKTVNQQSQQQPQPQPMISRPSSTTSAFSINNIIDSKNNEDQDNIDEPVMKKVRSNGEFYYQPINNNNNKQQQLKSNSNNTTLSYNSDSSSDDDVLPKSKIQQSTKNPFNNNQQLQSNTSPMSSPFSSPHHSSIEKLKATSFDFFNLESLATLASQSHELVN